LAGALPTATQVVTAIENVNNYWIPINAPANNDWTQATYFTGDLAAYDATGDQSYLTFAQAWASTYNYSLDSGNTTNYANYQAAGQVYIRLYELSNQSSDLSGIGSAKAFSSVCFTVGGTGLFANAFRANTGMHSARPASGEER
jgi:rhamnogalacturonyl hydrolase YesR